MKFKTNYQQDQFMVDKLIEHRHCENIRVEVLDDEIMLICEDCYDVIANYFGERV